MPQYTSFRSKFHSIHCDPTHNKFPYRRYAICTVYAKITVNFTLILIVKIPAQEHSKKRPNNAFCQWMDHKRSFYSITVIEDRSVYRDVMSAVPKPLARLNEDGKRCQTVFAKYDHNHYNCMEAVERERTKSFPNKQLNAATVIGRSS